MYKLIKDIEHTTFDDVINNLNSLVSAEESIAIVSNKDIQI